MLADSIIGRVGRAECATTVKPTANNGVADTRVHFKDVYIRRRRTMGESVFAIAVLVGVAIWAYREGKRKGIKSSSRRRR